MEKKSREKIKLSKKFYRIMAIVVAVIVIAVIIVMGKGINDRKKLIKASEEAVNEYKKMQEEQEIEIKLKEKMFENYLSNNSLK